VLEDVLHLESRWTNLGMLVQGSRLYSIVTVLILVTSPIAPVALGYTESLIFCTVPIASCRG
jgi:hypothetical protein